MTGNTNRAQIWTRTKLQIIRHQLTEHSTSLMSAEDTRHCVRGQHSWSVGCTRSSLHQQPILWSVNWLETTRKALMEPAGPDPHQNKPHIQNKSFSHLNSDMKHKVCSGQEIQNQLMLWFSRHVAQRTHRCLTAGR